MPANRDASGRFIKGQSGNPQGRKRMPENIKEALHDLVPDAVEIKRQILRSEDAPLDLKNRVADSVLDRIYGRPGIVEANGDKAELAKLDKLIEGINDAAVR